MPNQPPALGAPPVRRPYAKPVLVTIELRPDEAVLGLCKSTKVAAGPGNPTCTAASCSSLGS